MPSDASDGPHRAGEEASSVAALRDRACKVARHLARVIEELGSQNPGDIDGYAKFVEAAFRSLIPEPWLAFVESVNRAFVRCEGTAQDESGDAARLARRYFDEDYPDLTERAWPTRDGGRGRPEVRAAVAAWSRQETDAHMWQSLRAAACCLHPDNPDQYVPTWESMRRQWRKHARHNRLPPHPKSGNGVDDSLE